MKKIAYVLLAGLAVTFASCQKETELPEGGPATYSAAATSDTYFPKLAKNGTQIVTIAAVTEDVGVRDQLTATFKMGGSDLVAKYNESASEDMKALEFPAGACTFVKNEVVIDRYNKNSRSASISVTNLSEMTENLYVLPVLLESVTGSDKAFASTDKVIYYVFYALGLDKGKGTKDEPFLIYDTDDFVKIVSETKGLDDTQYASPDAAAAAVPTYFKMMNDVDLSGVDWEPVNYASPYNKKIDFNGNGKTISNLKCTNFKYPSIFGVLFGDVYDFTVENAEIVGNSAMAVVSGYVGTGNNIRGSIKHVTVKNSTVTGTGGDAKGAAIIAGRVQGCEIAACSAINCTVTVTCNFPGGIVGYTTADGSYIHDCLFNGTVTGGQRVGGIIGMMAKNKDKVYNCIALGSLEGQRSVGGVVGHANFDKWDERHVANEIVGCLAWNNITATSFSEDGASNGAIIGFTSWFNTGSACYRSPEMTYSIPNGGFADNDDWNPGGKYNTFFDQNDFSESSPLAVHVKQDASPKYARAPYNGKKATGTASEMAKKIGWDEKVWDLSGDVPVLK